MAWSPRILQRLRTLSTSGGCQQRPAEQRAGGQLGDRPDYGLTSRDHSPDDRRRPLRRLRPEAGRHHLHPVKPIPRGHGGGPGILAATGYPERYLCPRHHWSHGSLERLHPFRTQRHLSGRQSPEPVPLGDHLFQFAAGKIARRGRKGGGDRHPSNGNAGFEHSGQLLRARPRPSRPLWPTSPCSSWRRW